MPETNFDEHGRLLREIGDFIFEEYATLPLLWLTTDWTINPRVAGDYPISGLFGMRDLEYVVAAKEW